MSCYMRWLAPRGDRRKSDSIFDKRNLHGMGSKMESILFLQAWFIPCDLCFLYFGEQHVSFRVFFVLWWTTRVFQSVFCLVTKCVTAKVINSIDLRSLQWFLVDIIIGSLTAAAADVVAHRLYKITGGLLISQLHFFYTVKNNPHNFYTVKNNSHNCFFRMSS